MRNTKRVPKADYFRTRLQNALDNNLTKKANYYESRLIAMNEPTYKVEGLEVTSEKLGKLTRHNLKFTSGSNSMRIYSV